MEFFELKRLVNEGEHDQLEFKRKARHPDKIARELVAFANSSGGRLLIGVEDNGHIYGSKTPEEDGFVLQRYIAEHIFPALPYTCEYVPVTARRKVLLFQVEASEQRPHHLKDAEGRKQVFIRIRDMSVRASYEMKQVLRLQNRKKGVSIRYGETERQLFRHLEELPHITLDDTRKLLQLSRRNASNLLVRMVRAGLLRISPTKDGDYFYLSEEAFK